ncbi:glycosyltransferase family 9 protein [Desulfurobacterium atlanticum]|uniref:Heptosyltransferase I n=1 Tax=Desulfurobacterium atlanticum TaxID=240169 RepID=A0A238XNZ1_9BACT|nr:glycosyltransferase family 9 protein [Desulfurobacterium atlanticum]SNR60746.1 heptosyltransferase I [Desulfurobacterium atlanticum]
MGKKYNNERGSKLLKFLDRYFGIPVIFTLGFFNRKRKRPQLIEKIALLKTAAIGDTVLLSAIIRGINESMPQAKITLFTGSSNYEIAKIIAEAFFNVNVIKLPIKNPFNAISIIKQYEFDAWLDFGPWPRLNALFSYFANAKFKVGFKTKNQYRHYIYDTAVEHSDKIHELFNYKNILKQINIEDSNFPQIKVDTNVKKDKKLIVIHMFPGGSRSYLKEWPETYWIQLIDYLTSKGYLITLTGAKVDRNRALHIYNLCKRKDFVNVVAGELSLKDVILLLRKSFLVISVNTGIMHLASALNCNLVALHGPTSSKRWGPLNENSVAIQSPLKCSPCLNLGFEYGCNKNKCMESISVDTVLDAVRKFLRDI